MEMYGNWEKKATVKTYIEVSQTGTLIEVENKEQEKDLVSFDYSDMEGSHFSLQNTIETWEAEGYVFVKTTREEVPCGNGCGTTHINLAWFREK